MTRISLSHRILCIFVACLQNLTLGGVIFGWAAISGTLLISSENEGGPGLSLDSVHMMFVIAAFCNFFSPLVLGVVLDTWGPRMCSIISISFIGLGFALFSVSSAKIPLFIPATCLIAFGGPGVQNAIIHVSNLFPAWKASATACITGSFQLSFVVFLMFDVLWEQYGWSYKTLFMSYCGVCFCNLVVSLLLWPDEPFHFDEQVEALVQDGVLRSEEDVETDPHHISLGMIRLPSEFIHRASSHDPHSLASYRALLAASPLVPEQRNTDHQSSTGSDNAASSTAELSNGGGSLETQGTSASRDTPLQEKSFQHQLRSPEFVQLTTLFVVTSFWANFYIGTFDMQIADSATFGLDDQHKYARLFTLIMTCGVVAIPIVGSLMDFAGFPTTSVVMLLLGFMWALFLLVESPTALLVSFVFYASFRTFLFTFLFAYMADTLGFKYYGVLSGIMFAVAGCASLLQYPLSQYAAGTCHLQSYGNSECSRGRWGFVNAVMAATILLSFLFSYKDWMRRYERRTFSEARSQKSEKSAQWTEIRDEAAPLINNDKNRIINSHKSNNSHSGVRGLFEHTQAGAYQSLGMRDNEL